MTSTISGIDIEIASYIWTCLSAARWELLASVVFVCGWMIGKSSQRLQKSKPAKSGPKHFPRQGGKAPLRRTQHPKSLAQPPKSSERRHLAVGSFDGRIEGVNPRLLKDPSWAVPQISQLCHTQVQQALQLYRAALQAGLLLTDVPAESCQKLFATLLTATIKSGKMDEAMQLLSDLRKSGLGVNPSLFASTVKLCTSKHFFAEALVVLDFMNEDPDFILMDKSIWSCLLFCAIEAKAFHKCKPFFESLKACGTPSPKDVGNIVRLAAQRGDWNTALSLIQEMHDAGIELDSVQYNTTLGTCVTAGKFDEACTLLRTMESVSGGADAIAYNTIMKGYAKAGEMEPCSELFDRMKLNSVTPSQVTYGILLDGFINENQLERAMQIFNDMNERNCPMNTVLYTTLIKGFARAGQLQEAMEMYTQMNNKHGIAPDLITFSILIKANCDSDRLEEALKLLEGMVALGLRPDEVVFNNLIAGCSTAGNVKLGKQIYDDMIQSGVRPSNASFSIMIRLYHKCKLLEEAVVLLKTEPAKHKVEPEPRLFLQLALSCIRERQGKRAVEVYQLLAERVSPTAATHSSLIVTCLRLNMFDTAVEIISIAAASGARVDAQDALSLLEAVHKKGKSPIVRSCIAAMQTMGHRIDPQFVDSSEQLANSAPWRTPNGVKRLPEGVARP